MKLIRFFVFAFLFLAAVGLAAFVYWPRHYEVDLLVYRATPGGIIAALAAKQDGLSVALIEPSRHVGGMVTGGLGMSDVCEHNTVGGIARDFFLRVGKNYGSEKPRWNFESGIAEKVYLEMLEEAGIKVTYGQLLADVTRQTGRIAEITTNKGNTFKAKVFIDASYEGDLLAKGGISYTWGRESREEYAETYAGVLEFPKGRQFAEGVSAYDELGNLLPGVSVEPLAALGSSDKKIMAYNFRLCLTKKPNNKVPFKKPKNYDAKQYELLARHIEKLPNFKLKDVLLFHRVSPSKFCLNRNGPLSTNLIGENYDWPEASPQKRREIYKRHKDYTMGLMYFLSNDERVPEKERKELKSWGMCKDEFKDNDNFPYQLYVREARRMLGEYVLREADLLTERTKPDAIAVSSCPIEIHNVQRVLRADGTVANEGYFYKRVLPYHIPYRSLIPKRHEADNLIVPVAVSASHVAYSSLRMEPVYMMLGQAAGHAAAKAIQGNIAVQDVPVAEIAALIDNAPIRFSQVGDYQPRRRRG